MPTQGRDRTGYPFANITYSRDHGATWTVSNHAFSGGNESQAVQLGDGSIMLNMRNDRKEPYRAVYVTRDLGQTWEPHPTNRKALVEPNCNGSRVPVRLPGRGRVEDTPAFCQSQLQRRAAPPSHL